MWRRGGRKRKEEWRKEGQKKRWRNESEKEETNGEMTKKRRREGGCC